MEDLNPYAAPESSALPEPSATITDARCWRDGNELLVRPGVDLPRHCVKCGQPAEDYRLRRFYWHSPWLYLLLAVSIIIYLIVALCVRKQSSHRVGLCALHARKRRNYILLAWGSLLPLFGGFFLQDGGAIVIGVLVCLVMLFWGCIAMQVLRPKRINDGLAIYRGVSPEFLALLPRYPYRRD